MDYSTKDYLLQNATITKTQLGVKCSDHGMLTFIINLNYGNSGQSYGMLGLDDYSKELNKRIPTTLPGSLLSALDDVFEVNWEELKGLPCRAYCRHTNVLSIGHYLKNKFLWLDAEKMEFVVTKLEDIKNIKE